MNEKGANIYSFWVLRFIYYYWWYRIYDNYIVYSFENDTKKDVFKWKGIQWKAFHWEFFCKKLISFRKNYLVESVWQRSAGKEIVKQLKLSFSYEKKPKISDVKGGNMTTLTEFTLWETWEWKKSYLT